VNRRPMYASDFPPYRPGTAWASSPMPPSFQQARARFPHSSVLTSATPDRLVWFDGEAEDWWHESDRSFEAVFVMHLKADKENGLLLDGVALDEDLKEHVWGRSEGRWVFWTTKSWVVAIAFADRHNRINLCAKLRPIHKSLFGKWPADAQIEKILSAN